jgi:hypothetical protein
MVSRFRDIEKELNGNEIWYLIQIKSSHLYRSTESFPDNTIYYAVQIYLVAKFIQNYQKINGIKI